jgi:hypothetical protein
MTTAKPACLVLREQEASFEGLVSQTFKYGRINETFILYINYLSQVTIIAAATANMIAVAAQPTIL